MGPFYYSVKRINGDYTILIQTDISNDDEILVARALLPENINEVDKTYLGKPYVQNRGISL